MLDFLFSHFLVKGMRSINFNKAPPSISLFLIWLCRVVHKCNHFAHFRCISIHLTYHFRHFFHFLVKGMRSINFNKALPSLSLFLIWPCRVGHICNHFAHFRCISIHLTYQFRHSVPHNLPPSQFQSSSAESSL